MNQKEQEHCKRQAITAIIALSKGHQGTLECLTGLLVTELKRTLSAIFIIQALRKAQVVGKPIYTLFNDICDRNYEKMAHVCIVAPPDLLHIACIANEGQGSIILAQYVNTYQSCEKS